MAANADEKGMVVTGATAAGVTVKKNASVELGALAVKVVSDVENTDLIFQFDTTQKNELKNASGETLTFDLTSTKSLKINGVAPTLNKITMTKGDVAFSSGDTITVTGSGEAQTIQAKAASAKGTDITNKVTWSVSPADKGVTINASTGAITVANNAKDGNYTITATPKNGETLDTAKTATIKVARATAVAKTIEISGGVDTIYLPGNVPLRTGEFESQTNPVVQYWESEAFTAVVKNQYGEVMPDAVVEWTFTNANSSGPMYRSDGEQPDYCETEGCEHTNCVAYMWVAEGNEAGGLEISETGHLMITSASQTGTATVKAVCGDASATKSVTVTKAAPVVAGVKIKPVPTADVIIPADNATGEDTTATATFTAIVKDQYYYEEEGQPAPESMTGKTVQWSVTPTVAGVSIDNDGVLTVTNAAKNGIASNQTFTVTATCEGKTDTATVTVKRAGSVATDIAIYKNGTLITGDTDTVTIPTGDSVDYSYTAKVLDQYGAGMTSKTATLSLSGATDKGVTFNSSNGTLSVVKGATKDEEYTLTVSYGAGAGESRTITVQVKDIDITWPTVTKNSGTYGQTWNQIVSFSGGSAELNGQSVQGSFALADKNEVPNVGTKYKFVFTSDDGAYSVVSDAKDATIDKAPLTITAKDHEITYGDTPANSGVTYSGFVNNESASVLGGLLDYDYTYSQGNGVGNSYTITPKGLTSGNYDITFAPGTLTVKAKNLTACTVDNITGTFTYNGQAQTPDVTVTDDEKTLVKDTDYTVSYSNNKNAGIATATITGKGNYTGSVDKTFTINKAALTIESATFEDKTYDGMTTATVTGVTFSGLQNGETLALGTDYTATGEFAQAGKGDNVSASVTVTLGSTDKAKNYTLTAATKADAGSAKISPVQTTLSLTAANAVYTGVAYDESNITKTSNVETAPTYTYYADNDGVKGNSLTETPKNAGTYWVSGSIAASGNNSEVTSEAVQFQITKAPLTIKAEDKTVTYGDAAPAYTVTYTGLVNSETGATVVSGLDYACDYAQFSNAGTYTITPKGATAANYSITYTPGTLTVNKKEVSLTWSDDNLYYDGTAKTVTATATGLVNSDAVSVTVVGGTQTDIGQYTATATTLTGDKAGNYALPADTTHSFEIKVALTSVSVEPATITATVNGLTIKLTGYRTASETVTVTGNGDVTAADGKLTVNSVTYTVDASGVVVNDSSVTITEEDPTVTVDGSVTGYDPASDVSGLGSAAAEEVIDEAKQNETITQVEVTLEISVKSYTINEGTKEFKLEITPKVTYKNKAGESVGSSKTLPNSAIKAPVTIKIKLPGGMVTDVSASMFAKHLLSGGGIEYLPVTITYESGSYYASWQQSSFSEVTLVTDSRTATVAFAKADGSILNKTYVPADIGAALPTDSQTGKTFNGWSFTKDSTAVAGTFKTLTDALLTSLNGGTSITAAPVFTNNSGGSYSGGSSGGGSGKFAVSVDKASNGSVSVSPSSAKKGETVTVTVKPDKGYTLETLTVLDQNGKTVSVTAKNGTYTFTMPNGKATVKATFMDDNTMLNFFTDVPATAYCYDAVLWAVENGVTNGLTETTFGMNSPCTRGQIVTFLWRAAGSPAPKGTVKVPADVKPGSYCYDAVAWALENGVTNGFADGSFGVNTPCTRAQAVTFLYRAMGTAPSIVVNFTDVGSSAYYAEAVAWAVENEVTLGTTGTTFSPNNTCTRGHIVTFLYRAYRGL